MSATLQLIFGAEEDEQVVLSVCAIADASGGWRLVHGTLLVVPEDCAQVSWGHWRRAQGSSLGPELGPLSAALRAEGDGWLLARAVLSLPDAERWLEEVRQQVDGGEHGHLVTLPAVETVPELVADLHPPRMLVRSLPSTDSASAALIAGLSRPAETLLWQSEIDRPFAEPQTVEVDGTMSFLPAADLTGIRITPDHLGGALATPAGLLVGRAERRAWIREVRGSGDWQSIIIDLGWDPQRIALADLELTYEQLLDGEMVSSARLRIEDLDISRVVALGTCSVSMSSVGRSVAHAVSLHTLDGELLDRSGPYPLVERIGVSMTVNDEPLAPIVVGRTDPPPGLDERLERREQIVRDIEETVRNGVQARMIADRQTALDRLLELIAGARGELLVLDRYFGQDADEWRLLDSLPVPVRVLTAKIEKNTVPVIAAHVQARYRPKAALHERVWLWDGGGLAVGGSPTTFGQGPVRITRIRPAEVDEWTNIFNTEWQSLLYHEVPRQP